MNGPSRPALGRDAMVAVVGVGPIGGSIAEALVAAGHEVAVYDISPAAVDRAVAAGARLAADARAAASGRDVVVTALPTSAEVVAVVLDPARGLLAAMRPPALLIDVTTSAPAAEVELSERCADAGIDFLEAPVSGRAPHFTMFVGGARPVLDRTMPLLRRLGDEVVHVGDVGAGSRAKILHQFIAFGNFALACEALAIAGRAGLPLDRFAAALRGSRAASAMLPLVEATVLRRDFVDRGGPLAQIAKDMRLVRGLADDLGVPSSWVPLVTEPYLEAERAGLGRESAAAVAKVIEARLGWEISGSGGGG